MSSPSHRRDDEGGEGGAYDAETTRNASFVTPQQRQQNPALAGPPSRSSWSLSSSLRVLSRTSSGMSAHGRSASNHGGSMHGPASPPQPCSRALRTMVRRFVAAYYRDLNVAPSRVERYYTVR